MTSHDAKVAAILRAAGERKFAGIADAFMKMHPEEYAALSRTAEQALRDDMLPCSMHPVWYDAVNARHAMELAIIETRRYIPSYEEACIKAADALEAR